MLGIRWEIQTPIDPRIAYPIELSVSGETLLLCLKITSGIQSLPLTTGRDGSVIHSLQEPA